jgi:hypothetical protein
MGVEADAKGALGGGHAAFDEVVDLVGSYFAPIAGVALGFVFIPRLGGQFAIGNVVWNAIPQSQGAPTTYVHAAVGLLFTAIFGFGALALWKMGNKMSSWGKGVVRFFAGLLGGGAIGHFSSGVLGAQNSVAKGWFDNLVVFN